MVHHIYTEDFKREAVRLALNSDLSRQAIANDLGVGKSSLWKWISLYQQNQGFSPHDGFDTDRLHK